MPNHTLKSLAEVIPAQHAPIALAWFAQQLHMPADLRDAAEQFMRRLGAGGEAIAAHRDATRDLRELADRYDFELSEGDSFPEQKRDGE